jgi:HEAT repeat protein
LSLLVLIWISSLILTGTALIVVAALILARLLRQSLGRRRAERKRELVRQLLNGQSAPAALGRLRDDLLIDTFMDLVRLVRGKDRVAFVRQADELGIPARLARRLRSPSPRRRLRAAQALAEFHDEASLERLRRALSDPNDEVRLAAALSLAGLEDETGVHELVEHLGLGVQEDSMLAVTLFRTIAGSRPEEIRDLVLNPQTNPNARLAAIEALATTGDYSLVPLITQLALQADDGAEELPRYLRALGTLGHPAGAPAIMDGMLREAVGARAAAAAAAGKIGLQDARGRLAFLLDDEEWWVRYRAAEALVKLGQSGVEQLRQAATSGGEKAREAAATMLAEHSAA